MAKRLKHMHCKKQYIRVINMIIRKKRNKTLLNLVYRKFGIFRQFMVGMKYLHYEILGTILIYEI